MAYATKNDIITLYSEDALFVADRNGDGYVNDDAITSALQNASSEIDSYIGTRYNLPIANWPYILTQCCVDISLYRMALGRDVLSEEHRRRYDDAIDFVNRVAAGKATLNIAATQGDESAAASTSPRPIVTGGPAREFTREKMADL